MSHPNRASRRAPAERADDAPEGGFDKGARLNPEIMSYLKEIQNTIDNLSQSEDSAEQLPLLLDNVFEELKEKEYRLCVNPRGSKIVEHILSFAGWSHLTSFLKKIQIFLYELMVDRCASHVVQSLCKRFDSLNEAIEEGDESALGIAELIKETYIMFEHKWWDLACDQYASHVVRQWIQSTKDLSADLNLSIVLIRSLSVMSPGDIQSICCNTYGSPMMQVLMEAVQQDKDTLFKKISSDFNVLAFNRSGSRVAESMLKNSGNSSFREILEKSILPNLQRFVEDQAGNFVLQTALGNLRHPDQVLMCVQRMVDLDLRQTLISNRMGVLWKLAEACVTHANLDAQKLLVSSIIYKDEKSFLCKILNKCSHMASMLTQSLLQFQSHHLQIVKDFCSLEDDDLFALMKNQSGSYAAQAFLNNTRIVEKTKNKLLDKLKGKYGELVSSPHGSRCVETCFEKASLTRKQGIAKELLEVQNVMKGSAFGRAVSTKLQLDLFRRDSKEWDEFQSKQKKTVELFADILDDTAVHKKRKPKEELRQSKKSKIQ